MSVERAPRRVLAFEGEDGESGAPLRFCFVAAGAEHSLAVGASDGARGHLFTWGRGDHGRLGHGALDEPTCRRPTRVAALAAASVAVVAAAGGGAHSLALSADGDVRVWGQARARPRRSGRKR